MNHMLVASKEIDNFLQDDNINNKIDMFQTDYARCMYGFNYDENKNVNLLDKDYFLEEKENIVDKIGTVYCFKINKNTNEQENLFKGRIYDEAKKFRKRIIDGKKSALDEFNGYLTNYDIKLVKDKKKEKHSFTINNSEKNLKLITNNNIRLSSNNISKSTKNTLNIKIYLPSHNNIKKLIYYLFFSQWSLF